MSPLALFGSTPTITPRLHDGTTMRFGVTSGLELKDGKFEADLPECKFHLHGTLQTKDLVLFGYIRCPMWWDKKIDPPKKLLHGRPICHLG